MNAHRNEWILCCIRIVIIIKLAINMKEPFFSKSPHEKTSAGHQNNKEYTYFDSAVPTYLPRLKNILTSIAKISRNDHNNRSSGKSSSSSSVPSDPYSLLSNITSLSRGSTPTKSPTIPTLKPSLARSRSLTCGCSTGTIGGRRSSDPNWFWRKWRRWSSDNLCPSKGADDHQKCKLRRRRWIAPCRKLSGVRKVHPCNWAASTLLRCYLVMIWKERVSRIVKLTTRHFSHPRDENEVDLIAGYPFFNDRIFDLSFTF